MSSYYLFFNKSVPYFRLSFRDEMVVPKMEQKSSAAEENDDTAQDMEAASAHHHDDDDACHDNVCCELWSITVFDGMFT